MPLATQLQSQYLCTVDMGREVRREGGRERDETSTENSILRIIYLKATFRDSGCASHVKDHKIIINLCEVDFSR